MIVICKLTVAGGYRDIDLDPLSHGQVDRGQRPAHSPNMSDVDAVSVTDVEPHEIEPYDDGPDA